MFGVWTGIALASGVAAMLGNAALASAGPEVIAAGAGGAILAMLVDTIITEATEATHDYSGLIPGLSFLLAIISMKPGKVTRPAFLQPATGSSGSSSWR